MDKPLPPIAHYRSSGPDMTKWDMTVVISKVLGLPVDHVTPQATKPVIQPGQTERPWNTELSVEGLKELGIETAEEVSFVDWFQAYLTETK